MIDTRPEAPTATIIITSRRGGPALSRLFGLIRSETLSRQIQLLIVSPSRRASRIAAEHGGPDLQIEHVADKNVGRSAALNAALPRARAPLIVTISDHVSIESGAISALLEAFTDAAVDGACGHPVPMPDGEGLMARWQRLLLDAAHHAREHAAQRHTPFPLAGELFGFRRGVLTQPIPTNCWYPDAYVTQLIGARGAYVAEARVRVPGAPTVAWWLREKTQTLAAAQQQFAAAPKRVRRLRMELSGVTILLRNIRSARDAFAVVTLLLARACAWVGSWFALRFAPGWLADSHMDRYPTRAPQVAEVYDMALADLALADRGTCEVIVRQVIDDEHLRVVPRVAASSMEWRAIPSPAVSTVFPHAGAFLPFTVPIDLAQLGQLRGRCPDAQWRLLRDVV